MAVPTCGMNPTSGSARIRVLLADDDPLVRSSLRMMLAGARQLRVVGEASDGSAVLPAVDLHHPDMVLMDIRMPRLKLGAGNRVQIALLVQDATASRLSGPP